MLCHPKNEMKGDDHFPAESFESAPSPGGKYSHSNQAKIEDACQKVEQNEKYQL